MPVYVRRCLQCHKSAEHFAHMNADHDALTCPHCGGFTETDVQGQCRSQAMQGDELKGTRERLALPTLCASIDTTTRRTCKPCPTPDCNAASR